MKQRNTDISKQKFKTYLSQHICLAVIANSDIQISLCKWLSCRWAVFCIRNQCSSASAGRGGLREVERVSGRTEVMGQVRRRLSVCV